MNNFGVSHWIAHAVQVFINIVCAAFNLLYEYVTFQGKTNTQIFYWEKHQDLPGNTGIAFTGKSPGKLI